MSRRACRLLPWFALGSFALVFIQVALHLRNIPYWDEIDGVLCNLPRLDDTDTWTQRLAQLFALQNEHRIFASSLLFAAIHQVTNALNFAALGALGDSFLLGACAVLVARAGDRPRALRLAVILGLAVIHLQHHENLFWSGSSIDHFLVVLLAVGALAAVVSGSRSGLLAGVLLALAGSYTLAHGFVLWPVGAVLLVAQGQWRRAAVWSAAALFALACYLPGFAVNPAHHIEASRAVGRVLQYWLALLGATPALGRLDLAPWFGAALLGGLAWLTARRAWRAEPLAAAVIAFCVLALAVVAVGRTGVSGGIKIPSRYCILSALAWGLVAWVVVERTLVRGEFRFPRLALVAVALIGLNVALNVRFFGEGARFASEREASAQWFHYYHTLEGAPFPLFPRARQADRVLDAAAARGLYQLPHSVHPVAVAAALPTGNVRCVFDEIKADAGKVYVQGWAFLDDDHAATPRVAVVFATPGDTRAFAAERVLRPDVAAAFHDDRLAGAGFRLALPRDVLPGRTVTVGVALDGAADEPALALSSQPLTLRPGSPGTTRLLTSNRQPFTLGPNAN